MKQGCIMIDEGERRKPAWLFFFREFPRQTYLMVGLFILAGAVESLGAVSVIPLLSSLFNQSGQSTSSLEHIDNFFLWLGIEPSMTMMLGLFSLVMVFKGLLSLLAYQQTGSVVAEVMARLRLGLLEGLLIARWPFFMAQESGKLIVGLSTESSQAGMALRCFAQVLSSIIQAIVYLLVGFVVSWKVMIAGLVGGCLFAFLFKSLVRSVRLSGKEQVKTMNDMTASMSEFLGGVKPLKSMALEQSFLDYISLQVNKYKDAVKRQVFGVGLLTSVQEPFLAILLCGGLAAAISWYDLAPATLLAMAFFSHRIVSRIANAQQHWQVYVGQESALRSLLMKINEVSRNRMVQKGTMSVSFSDRISLSNVSFGYGDKNILIDFSVDIEFGEITALYGPSGVGKTTVADIVVGLLAAEKGKVTIDGVSLNDIDMGKWRSSIGYVPQEVFLFHDSVRENILLGRSHTDEEVWTALERAGAAGFVKKLQGGLDSIVGEHGRALSGGQRQRLMIARALLSSPKVLILDEATTGLESEIEKAILESVVELKKDMAVLAISHQPAVKDMADKVIRIGDRS